MQRFVDRAATMGAARWLGLCRSFSSAAPSSFFAGQMPPLTKRGAKAVTAQLRALRSDAAVRTDKKQVVIFGRTLVEEYLAQHGAQARHLFAAPACHLRLPTAAALQPVVLDAADIAHAAGVDSAAPSDACACVVPLPVVRSPSATTTRRVLVLDALGDPGNVGSIVRSAIAFDFSVVLLGPGGCDPFNSKVLRSSMGAVLSTPPFVCDEAALRALLEAHKRAQPNLRVLVTDAASAGCAALPAVRIAHDDPVWVLIGNEAHGVRESLRGLGSRVHIPTSGRIESLNAAAAAAILMQHVYGQQQTCGSSSCCSSSSSSSSQSL